MTGHAVVIGGGVIGAACAHHLTQSGWQVTILEQGQFGSGCSHGNCGFVCPSHVLPLAEPGAVWQAVRSLFQRNAPLRVRWRLDPALWGWFWQFARRCNVHDMLTAGRACQALLERSMQLYQELVHQEPIECEWQLRGLLFVYEDPRALAAYEPTNELLAEQFNLPARRYDAEQLLALEPALKPGLAGAWYYEHDAHLRPDKLLRSWRALLERRGVAIREQCTVEGFERQGHTATAVRTNQGAVSGDTFVVATGALTPVLGPELGCRIPIQPGKGYSLTMPRPETCPGVPMIFPQHRVAVTPMQSAYRLGSMMEFSGYDRSIQPRRLALLTRAAEVYLREPYQEPIEERWYGWRPMTFDGVPIIDTCPALGNVLIAAGHNMLGLSMAPATGELVAQLLNNQTPQIDPAPYRLARFSNC